MKHCPEPKGNLAPLRIDSHTSRIFAGRSGRNRARASRPTQNSPLIEEYGPEFFSVEEWAFIIATARIIPSDGDGPGAYETRVPAFIDREMAGEYGSAADWYMESSFEPDADPRLG